MPLAAQDLIFADGFEMARTCWIWSGTAGGTALCYDMPYEAPPPVTEELVQVTAEEPTRIDVIFGLDTTGSMGGEIAVLKASIGPLIDDINASIPDSAFAVTGYDDFPYGGYGSAAAGDKAFYLLHRAMTASTTAGKTSLLAAVDLYETHGGGDLPESGWEMVYQVATGLGNGTGQYSVPPFDPATAPPAVVPAGEEIGDLGGVGLRQEALPILVWITDVRNHNSAWTSDPYGEIPGVTPAGAIDALHRLVDKGGRVIGMMSGEGARLDLTGAIYQTGSVVEPSAWGVDDRPLGCLAGQCCTGLNGTGVSTVSNMCPLLFEIDGSGAGLGVAVTDGINHLVHSRNVLIGGTLKNHPQNPIDAVTEFVDRFEADANAPLPCAEGLSAIDINSDGVFDTFQEVQPGTIVCFNLVLKTNTTVPTTGSSQVFSAWIEFVSGQVHTFETRRVFFRVPP